MTFSLTYGNLFYNPFHALSIVLMDLRCSAMHGATILAVSRFGGDRNWNKSRIAARLLNARAYSGAGLWALTPQWKVFIDGLGGLRY